MQTNQYRDFRFIVSEKIKAGIIKTFDDVVRFALQDDEFGVRYYLDSRLPIWYISSIKRRL